MSKIGIITRLSSDSGLSIAKKKIKGRRFVLVAKDMAFNF